MWLAHRADNSAILVMMNVKVRMEAQHSIPAVNLHDFLWESFTFFTIYTPGCTSLRMHSVSNKDLPVDTV